MTDSNSNTAEVGNTEAAPVRAMKRIGTFSNYIRITPSNEHLLNDNRMVEVSLVVEDILDEDGEPTGKTRQVEANVPNRDFLASKSLAPVVAEILSTEAKLNSLVAHAATLVGGVDALASVGIEVAEQTMEDTPAGRAQDNVDKQAAKAEAVKAERKAARNNAIGKAPASDESEGDAKPADDEPTLDEDI